MIVPTSSRGERNSNAMASSSSVIGARFLVVEIRPAGESTGRGRGQAELCHVPQHVLGALLDRHALREIARLIDVAAALDRDRYANNCNGTSISNGSSSSCSCGTTITSSTATGNVAVG